VPALVSALHDKHASVRAGCLAAIARIRPPAKDAVPAVTAALDDPAAEVRSWAAIALGNIGPAATPALPALCRTLRQDRNGQVRMQAAAALGYLGPKARAAIPALLEALADEQYHVSSWASIYLKTVVPDATAIPVLVKLLGNSRDYVRANTAEVLGFMGPEAYQAVPNLVQVLRQDPQPTLRSRAALALGGIGPKAKDAIPALIQAMQSGDSVLERCARDALRKIAPEEADKR
jgi:HEAT repeat protein